MGHNDHFEENRPELPAEAGESSESGFQTHDEWLKTADDEMRHEAMRQWFLSRYWDPANDTPYNGREGGYLYIHGGPFDAEEELYRRFGDLFPDEVIRAVIDDVESDGITEWAPIHTESSYDEDFEFEVAERDSPHRFFRQQLIDLDALAAIQVDPGYQELLRQLLYSYLISALEAYLADTMSYWLKEERAVFRRFVSNCEDFKKQKLPLTSIFDRMDILHEDVERYLQGLVWHRLDKVIPLLTVSLGIKRPAIGELMKHILVRHDIVHRSGKTKSGEKTTITQAHLNELRTAVISFIDEIETEIQRRYPVDISGFLE